VVRVLQLVWSSSRLLTSGLAASNILQSVLPVLQVWLAGRLIDEVVEGFNAGGGDEHIRSVIYLALAQGAIFLASGRSATSASNCSRSASRSTSSSR
jgi:hypothetical protein